MDDIGREIQRAQREEAQNRKRRWNEDHPKTAAFKSGWGDALAKEGRHLVRDVGKDMKRLFGV